MRKLRRIIIGLALLSAVSQQDFAPLVHLVAFPLAIVLFPFALAFVAGALISPFAFWLAVWLLWCRHRDGEYPAWARKTTAWLIHRVPPRLRASTWTDALRSRVSERWPRRAPRECAGRSMRPGRCRDCPLTRTQPAGEGARSAVA
jgi:hypothetical protein